MAPGDSVLSPGLLFPIECYLFDTRFGNRYTGNHERIRIVTRRAVRERDEAKHPSHGAKKLLGENGGEKEFSVGQEGGNVMMKKMVALCAVCTMAAGLLAVPAAAASSTSESVAERPAYSGEKLSSASITLFAAKSLNQVMEELIVKYNAFQPDVKVVGSYDSSGTLMTQIEEGAPCDVFFSAAQKQMDELSDKGMIEKNTRADVVNNQVCVVTYPGSGTKVTGLENLGNISEAASFLSDENLSDEELNRRLSSLESEVDEALGESDVHGNFVSFIKDDLGKGKEVWDEMEQRKRDEGVTYVEPESDRGLLSGFRNAVLQEECLCIRKLIFRNNTFLPSDDRSILFLNFSSGNDIRIGTIFQNQAVLLQNLAACLIGNINAISLVVSLAYFNGDRTFGLSCRDRISDFVQNWKPFISVFSLVHFAEKAGCGCQRGRKNHQRSCK